MKSPQNNPNPQAESATATSNATGKLLFDIREAAARLSISVVSVRNLIRQKRLKRVPDFRNVLKTFRAKLAVPQFSDTTRKSTDFNDPAALGGVVEIKLQIESAAPRQTDVERFNASTFTSSPVSSGILTFSREIQLSPHSALMGGQFPTENNHDAFKNLIFYAVAAEQIASKNKLSDLMVQKTSFYAVFEAVVATFWKMHMHKPTWICCSPEEVYEHGFLTSSPAGI